MSITAVTFGLIKRTKLGESLPDVPIVSDAVQDVHNITLHVDGGNLKVGEVVRLELHAGVDYEDGDNVFVVKESLCSIVQLHLGQRTLASIGHHDDISTSPIVNSCAGFKTQEASFFLNVREISEPKESVSMLNLVLCTLLVLGPTSGSLQGRSPQIYTEYHVGTF